MKYLKYMGGAAASRLMYQKLEGIDSPKGGTEAAKLIFTELSP